MDGGLRGLAGHGGTAGRRGAAAHGLEHVTAAPGSALFAGIPAGTRFYFVHSYALRAAGPATWRPGAR